MTRKQRNLIVLAALAAAYFSTYAHPEHRPSAVAKVAKAPAQVKHHNKE